MQVRRLDHVNIQTTRLDKMVAWYEEILGLRTGPRPVFPFPGAWLYTDGDAVIHLVGHDGDPAVGSEQNLKLEHFALTATGKDTFESKLNERKHHYERLELEGVGLVQFHLRDPDGNHVHVDFAGNDND
ncbi:catechol 2,3-dioxygenase-like lactoylglutathione lyase family enzyme [Aliiruegeria haliotis]|uniref:Catechol 2,3-dioxygenase-like lactoylglutathione lyase family enzyme n=1 Tax=Aliiruegeria haliotis TaxID=1280846 RepID=A0A2T0RH84_9RHOB|nr:VOC family protein [Aliiruegeria haliotis]PRY20528.1 catechol 2,3-dioxygenase-like lactoylglutathione lyase family enzyme [Aliiruegeria haliotis]